MNQEILRDLKPSKTSELPAGGPGTYLRKGRELRRQSQLDIAKQLQLNPAVIDALENDRYDKLPGAIFVRGYLRAYARIVDLAEDEIVQIYNNLGFGHDSALPKTLTQSYPAAERSGKSYPMLRWLPYLLLLTLVGLLFIKYVEIPANVSTLFSPSPPAPSTESQAFSQEGGNGSMMVAEGQGQQTIEIEGSVPLVRSVPESTPPVMSQPVEVPIQAGE